MGKAMSNKATDISRRDFLKGSSLTAVTAVTLPTIVPSSVFGAEAPSNRIMMGCIGTGGQGSGNMRGFNAKSDCQVVAICDVDSGHRESARKRIGLDPKSCYNDFLDCIKSRKDPICNAEIGHRSSTVCHLGNIAMLLDRPLKWDPQNERFIGDDEANRMTWRPRRAPWRL